MANANVESVAPFFMVSDVSATIRFYCDQLGFEVQHREPETEPFFAIVGREGAWIFLKHGGDGVTPAPNPDRAPEVKWDAYVSVRDPDALAAEFAARGATFRQPLMNTTENLRGFEIADPDGYVLFFGRPRETRS